MSYQKDMQEINGFVAMAEFTEAVRRVAHIGGTDAIVSDGNNKFLLLVRCAKEDMEGVKRRVASIKKAKVNQIAENLLGVNLE